MQEQKNLLAIKCAILDMELDKKANHAHLLNYKYGDETAKNAFIDEFGDDWYKIARNLVKARDKRKKRVFDRVGSLLLDENVKGYFITLTFKDKVLATTTPITRRRYVARWLKKYYGVYIANLDFGGKKGREHYHGLGFVSIPLEAYKEWHKLGALKIKPIHDTKNDKVKVTKYVVKLSAHFVKDSTLKAGYVPRIIYSKSNYKQFNFSEVF